MGADNQQERLDHNWIVGFVIVVKENLVKNPQRLYVQHSTKRNEDIVRPV